MLNTDQLKKEAAKCGDDYMYQHWVMTCFRKSQVLLYDNVYLVCKSPEVGSAWDRRR